MGIRRRKNTLNSRKLSIYGGSGEIQRNIICASRARSLTRTGEASMDIELTEDQEYSATACNVS